MSAIRMSMSFSCAALFAASLGSQSALALPRPGEVLPDPALSALVSQDFQADDYDYNGISKLNNCSGALVRYETSKPDDKAMILTNGHCVPANTPAGFLKPNTFLFNTAATRSFKFLKKDGSLGTASVNSTKILYATMTGSDMALYQLSLSFKEIEQKYDVDALTISNQHPVLNDAIEVLSGYWQRGYSCHIDQFIFKMQEDQYFWNDSVRYSEDGCHTIHGTSGSPVLSKATHKVVAINNTGNDDGKKCTLNNPCEVSDRGEITFKKGLSYAQQTYIIYSCLNDKQELDLAKQGCKLFH